MLFPSIFDDMAFEKDSRLMKTDVIKGENETKFVVDVPGFKKEDLSIDLKDGYLTVSAQSTNENNNEEEGKYIYRERVSRSCSRTFDVGSNVSHEDIDASLNDGVLTLCVKNNKEIAEAKKIEIK